MDYYLKTTNKEQFLSDLEIVDIKIILEGNYYQDDNIIIDWVGKIPYPYSIDENGDIIGEIKYRKGEHVNIRSVKPIDISKFINTENVSPNIPYRIFS